MKKYIVGVLAIATAFGASAFTAKPATASLDPSFYWFAPNGAYLGNRTAADQDLACPGSGNTCANGYSSIDEDGHPVGSIQSTVEKQ